MNCDIAEERAKEAEIENDPCRDVASSPLEPLGPLLRLYSYIGVVPASVSGDLKHFEVSWCRHMPLVVMFAVTVSTWTGLMYLTESLSEGTTNRITASHEGMNMTTLGIFNIQVQQVQSYEGASRSHSLSDVVLSSALSQVNLGFVVAMAICNHQSFQHLEDIIRLFTLPRSSQPSARAPLTHHIICLVAEGSVGVLIVARWALFLQTGLSAIVVATAAVTFVSSMYMLAVTSAPELIIVRLLQSIASEIEHCLDGESDSADTRQFLSGSKKLYKVFKILTDTFGTSLMVMFSCSLVLLVISAYYTVTINVNPNMAGGAVTCILFTVSTFVQVKRLVHVTNYAQRLVIKFEEASEDLLEEDSKEAKQVWRLYSQINGLPVNGFFTINRSILLAILSHILTYLIILIEFKLSNNM